MFWSALAIIHQKVRQHYTEMLCMYTIHLSLYRDFFCHLIELLY
jgi:hypothetical protein